MPTLWSPSSMLVKVVASLARLQLRAMAPPLPPLICRLADRLEVVGVDTIAPPAPVVEHHALWNGASLGLVDHAVG